MNKWTDGKAKFVLHKVETIDEANLGYDYNVVGGAGAALPDSAEKSVVSMFSLQKLSRPDLTL